jgi:hypothetical protein
LLTRRRFVKLIGGAAALAAMPLPTGCGDDVHPIRGVFFDEHQWATIDLITGYIVPGDDDAPGAREAMAVRYIDGLLAAFEHFPEAPHIFAGGPFSGREPYPDVHGQPSAVFPPSQFGKFLSLPRVREIAWRMRVYGSAQTPGGDFNDALLGPTEGWQHMYADAIERLDAGAGAVAPHTRWRYLGIDDRSTVLYTVASDLPTWWQAIVEHTLEGMFSAPEYGGNEQLVGWKLARWDGDSSPLGHAYYDASFGDYRDREDQPTAQPSPDAATEDFDQEVIDTLTVAAIGSGGMRFY